MPDRVRPERMPDNTLVKALARAFRWKRMLVSGEFATITELAVREGIAPSYLTRVLRLTLLAPNIVEVILDGRQEPNITLASLIVSFPVEWEAQRQIWREAVRECSGLTCDPVVIHPPGIGPQRRAR